MAVKITEDQLKETYSQKETEELLELQSSGTLTDLAQVVLDKELKKRSVTTIEKEIHRQSDDVILNSAKRTGLASLERRLVAYLIDFFIPVLVILPINFGAFMVLPITIQDNISTGSFVLWIAYLLFKDSVKGQSIGKKLLKVCVIDDDSGLLCSAPKSFFRNFPSLFGLIGFSFLVKRKKGWVTISLGHQ